MNNTNDYIRLKSIIVNEDTTAEILDNIEAKLKDTNLSPQDIEDLLFEISENPNASSGLLSKILKQTNNKLSLINIIEHANSTPEILYEVLKKLDGTFLNLRIETGSKWRVRVLNWK